MTDDRYEIGTRPYFLWFSSPLRDPGLRLVPRLVESEQTGLSPTLDELVGLCYEFGGEDPRRELSVGSDGVRRGVPCDLSDFGCGVDKVSFDLGMRSDGRGALEPVSEEELGVVFTDGCMIVSDENMKEEVREQPLEDMMGEGEEEKGLGYNIYQFNQTLVRLSQNLVRP
jgi:hypothetical protein